MLWLLPLTAVRWSHTSVDKQEEDSVICRVQIQELLDTYFNSHTWGSSWLPTEIGKGSGCSPNRPWSWFWGPLVWSCRPLISQKRTSGTLLARRAFHKAFSHLAFQLKELPDSVSCISWTSGKCNWNAFDVRNIFHICHCYFMFPVSDIICVECSFLIQF